MHTDHYAIAFFISGAYYVNPLYWGSSCYGDSDCTVGPVGTYAYYITVASIYVGSTLADQTNVPANQVAPAFDLNAFNQFYANATPPFPSDVPLNANITQWITAITSAYLPIKLVYYSNSSSINSNSTFPPIPYMVDLVNDCYNLELAERQRTFVLKDLFGRPWNPTYPIRVRERFSNMLVGGGADAPVPNGTWSNKVPPDASAPKDEPIVDSSYTDHHQGTPLNVAAQTSYLQYYYATDFTLPSSSLASEYRAKGQNQPLPMFLELTSETQTPWVQGTSLASRTRRHMVKDTNGSPWKQDNHGPLSVYKTFIWVFGTGGMPAPDNPSTGGGGWSIANGQISPYGLMDDLIEQLTPQPEVDYLQLFWATGFNPPALVLPPGITDLHLPAAPNEGPQIPLFIRDLKSKCKAGDFSVQGVELNTQFIGVNGDHGIGTACQN